MITQLRSATLESSRCVTRWASLSRANSLSAVGTVIPGYKRVALDAHCWEAFVCPCLSQAQDGRSVLQKSESPPWLNNRRDELPNVRMQDVELFLTNRVWLSAVQSALSCLHGAGATSTSSPALLDSVRIGEIPLTRDRSGRQPWRRVEAQDVFPQGATVRQPRREMRAGKMLR